MPPTVAVVFEATSRDLASQVLPVLKSTLEPFRPTVELRYPDSDQVSIRVSLRETDRFLAIHIALRNHLAFVSEDSPFPETPALLTDADRVLLLELEVSRIVFDVCRVPLSAHVTVMVFHEHAKRTRIWRQCWSPRVLRMDIDLFRSYYGESVMYYFAWLNHYNTWLIAPALVGTCLAIGDYVFALNDRVNPVTPFYSIFMIVWSTLFVKTWERQAHFLALSCRSTEAPLPTSHDLRRGFFGELRVSPVTGETELHYPGWKRQVKQPLSWLLTLLCLGVALLVQICSMNLQGYMSAKQHELFEIPFFAAFAEPGAIFDQEGSFALVPVVVHSLTILVLNDIYRHIAHRLTVWENYPTQEEHDDALTQKRVFFEFVDCFSTLLYIAFYRLDATLLRQELISLFMVDQLRRVMLESLLPWLWQHRRRVADVTAIVEEQMPEYDSFDDFLEMVMQFGYVTLFSSAFPLGGAVALLGNMIEVRSDVFKFSYVLRRPVPRRAHQIGSWSLILQTFSVLSIVTNSLLFGFTSKQMQLFFPDLFEADGTMQLGDGRFVVAVVFILEHSLLILVAFLFWRIPSVPKKAREERLRREHRRLQQLRARAAGQATPRTFTIPPPGTLPLAQRPNNLPRGGSFRGNAAPGGSAPSHQGAGGAPPQRTTTRQNVRQISR